MVELIGTLFSRHGTPDQQGRYLKDILAAKIRIAYCLTEAEAGSDLSNVKTTVRESGDGWLLNGAKYWIHKRR